MCIQTGKNKKKGAISVRRLPWKKQRLWKPPITSHDENNHGIRECEETDPQWSETQTALSEKCGNDAFFWKQCDRCDHSPKLHILYMAGWTACEWVERLTLKKDLHVRLAIGRTEKVKSERKTLRQMKIVCNIAGKIKFAPGKRAPCHSPSYTQGHLQYKLKKSRNPDLQSVCFENKWSDEELLDKLTQPSYRMTGILHDVLHAVLPHLCLPDKNLLQYKNRLLSGAMALVAHLDHCQYSVSYMSILFSFTSGFF